MANGLLNFYLNLQMNFRLLLFFCFLFFFYAHFSRAQHANAGKMIFEGRVYGYEYDSSRKLLKKNKQVVLEGILEGVTIAVFENDKQADKTISNKKGEFRLTLKLGHLYRIELSKKGYNKNILLIDTKTVPSGKVQQTIKFNDAEFILNSFQANEEQQEAIGKLFYDEKKGYIDFRINENRYKKTGLFSKRTEPDNSVELMKRAVTKNKNNFQTSASSSSKRKDSPGKSSANNISKNDSVESPAFKFNFLTFKGIENLTEKELSEREEEIKTARKKLDLNKQNAKTREDSLLILKEEAELNAAELELKNAREIISLQNSEIKTQKKLLFLTISSLIVLAGFFVLFFISYKEKKRINLLLEKKRKKIFDSINYAKRIQQSILIPEKEIQKFLPDSFIYYQPKDIVSGDFYWFSHLDGKLFLATVDCTGHGVPGAFMSLIGNTLLNEIINEKHITDTVSILEHLHSGVLKALHQETDNNQAQDGMEISLCMIDREQNKIEYAGAMTPLYIVRDNEVTIIHANIQSIGGKNLRHDRKTSLEFTKQVIPFREGISVYMFTDGYMDQFGGEHNSKFNTQRFKQLLLDIQKLKMNEQKEVIHSTIQNWKGNYQQIDDMLVVGFRV